MSVETAPNASSISADSIQYILGFFLDYLGCNSISLIFDHPDDISQSSQDELRFRIEIPKTNRIDSNTNTYHFLKVIYRRKFDGDSIIIHGIESVSYPDLTIAMNTTNEENKNRHRTQFQQMTSLVYFSSDTESINNRQIKTLSCTGDISQKNAPAPPLAHPQ